MIKRVNFQRHKPLAFLLLAPQMLVLAIFVFWPAAQALYQAFTVSDPFGQRSTFVWFDNFRDVLTSPEYFNSIYRTAIFSTGTTASAVLAGLAFAVLVDRVVRGKSVCSSSGPMPWRRSWRACSGCSCSIRSTVRSR